LDGALVEGAQEGAEWSQPQPRGGETNKKRKKKKRQQEKKNVCHTHLV